jgi:formylglycine-generating enzyme required for sulfatase activity
MLQLARALAGLIGLTIALGVWPAPARAEVAMDWVRVGRAGNACEVQSNGCFGAVGYVYQIGRVEVTNAQYAELLNAVAATDTYSLYNTYMNSTTNGGISRSGSSGSYTYSAKPGMGSKPVNYVSFYDALRFANWMHNGQPTGAQDDTTTEDGAYTVTEEGIAANSIARNPGARVHLASEDEWYKAAYYKLTSSGYFDYPAGSDDQVTCASPGPADNMANCNDVVATVTDVGAYTGSASPAGTFDQGGNLWEWHEAIIVADRGVRGGSFVNPPHYPAAQGWGAIYPKNHDALLGFRVTSAVAVGSVPSLAPVGAVLLGSLLGLVAWRTLSSRDPLRRSPPSTRHS